MAKRKIRRLSEHQLEVLVKLYMAQELSVEKLPYTLTIQRLLFDFNQAFPGFAADHWEVYNQLTNLRKTGKLPKKAQA